MKILKRFMIVAAISGALITIGVAGTVSAQQATLTSEQATKVRENCGTIKNTLNQLHVSDAYLRVNRGQLYESIATKLMERFNARLQSNDFDPAEFTTITKSYRTTLDSFRTHYRDYERQLSAALDIDCTKKPSEFHAAVDSARTKRTQVHSDIGVLNGYITSYQTSLEAFYQRYQQITSGVIPQ